jgi:lysophospholipase L1-like esterase
VDFDYIILRNVDVISPASEKKARPLRILCLGDSYTIGESVPPQDSWPQQLAARLREYKLDVSPPTILAQTGWTTAELAENIQATRLEPPYDMVTLLIGVNNQYRGEDLQKYRVEFHSLLEHAVRLAGNDPTKVIVLSIPDWGVTPFAASRHSEQIGRQIDAFNQVNRDIAQARQVMTIDITPISRQAAHDPTLLANDGLHPSAKMYAAWVDILLLRMAHTYL